MKRRLVASQRCAEPAFSVARLTALDLRAIYVGYDDVSFDFFLSDWMADKELQPLGLRFTSFNSGVAGRMETFLVPTTGNSDSEGITLPRYAIGMNKGLIAQAFVGGAREVVVHGVTCSSPLEALLVVFEHELVHLLLALVGEDENHGPLVISTTQTLFGHTKYVHDMPLPQAQASKARIQVGDRVVFIRRKREVQGVVRVIGTKINIDVSEDHPVMGTHFRTVRVPIDKVRRV